MITAQHQFASTARSSTRSQAQRKGLTTLTNSQGRNPNVEYKNSKCANANALPVHRSHLAMVFLLAFVDGSLMPRHVMLFRKPFSADAAIVQQLDESSGGAAASVDGNESSRRRLGVAILRRRIALRRLVDGRERKSVGSHLNAIDGKDLI